MTDLLTIVTSNNAALFHPHRQFFNGYSDWLCRYARLDANQYHQDLAVLLSEDKSDEQLMEAYRDGDLQAFDILFSRFKDILFRYLARQTGNMAIAEELFQEAWAALIKNRNSYSVKAKFKTYLFHIAHNKLIDYYRSKHNKYDLESYEDTQADSSLEQNLDDDLANKADISKKYEYLLQLIERLPASQRDAFLMHEEAGMTLPEIAEVMDVSRDTVKSRLRYAMQRLRQGMRRFT